MRSRTLISVTATTSTSGEQVVVRDRRLPVRASNIAFDYGIFVALAAIVVFFSVRAPYFLTVHNLLNVGQAVAVSGIMAVGITILLIAGQIDLSITAVLALVTVIVAQLAHSGMDLTLAALIGMAAAGGVGAANSLLVVHLRINSIVATLAMSLAIGGVAEVVAKGQIIPLPINQFTKLGMRVHDVPVPVIIMLALYALGSVWLYQTRAGWHVYAIGANRSAAERAGIGVARLYWVMFIACALMAGLAGLITASLNSSGDASFAVGQEFNVLAGVLIGGIGLSGGAGRLERTLAGVLIIGILQNGLILMNVQSFYQQMISGAVFVLAVVLDAFRERRGSR